MIDKVRFQLLKKTRPEKVYPIRVLILNEYKNVGAGTFTRARVARFRKEYVYLLMNGHIAPRVDARHAFKLKSGEDLLIMTPSERYIHAIVTLQKDDKGNVTKSEVEPIKPKTDKEGNEIIPEGAKKLQWFSHTPFSKEGLTPITEGQRDFGIRQIIESERYGEKKGWLEALKPWMPVVTFAIVALFLYMTLKEISPDINVGKQILAGVSSALENTTNMMNQTAATLAKVSSQLVKASSGVTPP